MVIRLPKEEILRGHRAFTSVFTTGKQVAVRSVKFFYVLEDFPKNRIGFSISRNIRGSVVRNRAKRCLREGYRHYRQDFPTLQGKSVRGVFMYVGTASEHIVRCTSIQQDLQKVIQLLRQRIQRS